MIDAIRIIEHAGQHLIRSNKSGIMRHAASHMNATQAAHSYNSDVQALAVLAVLLARITDRAEIEWVDEICETLGLAK